MNPLIIETVEVFCGSKVMKVTGFSAEEIRRFRDMWSSQLESEVVDALNKRNNGLGSVWHNGYGIGLAWVEDGAVMVKIGVSCD